MFCTGSFRVKSHDIKEAFVRTDAGDFRVAQAHRNRAIHGDTVVIQPLASSDKPAAMVVSISQRIDRQIVCVLQTDNTVTETQLQRQKVEALLAIPMDIRLPKIRIRTRHGASLLNSRFVVRVDSWELGSMWPNGHFLRELGPIGNVDVDTEAILVENSITALPFAPAVLAALPSELVITPEDERVRRDLRDAHRVFSIDPPGCVDVDDTLSARRLASGRFEIGVHIADVTHFMPQGSLLDREAQMRSSTVYMVDRRFNMLPSALSEGLCSLHQGVDRMAVSVIWEFDENANIVSTWFGRTIIRSCNALSYEEAQAILEGTVGVLPDLKHEENVRLDLKILARFGFLLREARLKKGGLELSTAAMEFSLDDKKAPNSVHAHKDHDVNQMVAEYMITANASVAKQIYSHFPTAACLRRHPAPVPTKIKDVVDLGARAGFQIDASSNLSLASSFNTECAAQDTAVTDLLKTMTSRAMDEAAYFSTGAVERHQYFHYGLALDFYTHFTSPIRRYADVLVHRALLASLDRSAPPPTNSQLTAICDHMNAVHRQTKKAQRESTDYFLAQYFGRHEDHAEAIVFNVHQHCLKVFVPKYQFKGIVYLAQKTGEVIVPPGLQARHPTASTSDWSLTHDPDVPSLSLLLHGESTCHFKILDRITVRLWEEISRAHLPQTKLELVGKHVSYEGSSTRATAAHTPLDSSGPVSSRDLAAIVRQEERSERVVRGLMTHDIHVEEERYDGSLTIGCQLTDVKNNKKTLFGVISTLADIEGVEHMGTEVAGKSKVVKWWTMNSG